MAARCAVAFVLLAMPSIARAQDAPPMRPPLAQSSTDVPYPPGAHGDASVLLELSIAGDGSVTQADVIEGAAPFAEAARAEALRWQFTPALRGETPVPARIRARVEFHGRAQAAPPMATPTSPAPPQPSAAPLEVTVRGVREEIGETTLSAGEVRAVPGAFGDAFRAVDATPYVTPITSGLPYYYFRGAPPNNNGFFVDGVRVPLLFHVGLGAGIIHSSLIERVDVFPSAAPASYGGFAGAIIDGKLREPSSVLHGEASLRLVDAAGLVEVPFDAGAGSVLVAGHYGYPGPILSAIASNLKLGYWDYQTRASWRFADGERVTLFAFGSHDYLASGSPLTDQLASDFHRVDLHYDREHGSGRIRVGVTAGYDRAGAAPSYMRDYSAAARVEFEEALAHGLRLRAGASARFDAYGYEHHTPEPRAADVPTSLNPPPVNLRAGLYADLVWRVSERVELVAGARVDAFGSRRADKTATLPAVDPRLALRTTIASGLASITSLGLAHQYPALRVANVPVPAAGTGEGFQIGHARLQSAAQASQGIELSLPGALTLTAAGFDSEFWGMNDLTAGCYELMQPTYPSNTSGEPRPADPYYCPGTQPVRGRTFGLELSLRRALTERVSGWLTYTLSRSTQQAHFPTLAGGEAEATVASQFDHTHVATAAISCDLGAGWRAGARFVFYTGSPYSALAGSIPIPPYDAYRTPPFARLDVRLEKRWTLDERSFIALVLEGQNVTLSKETSTLGQSCDGVMTAQGGMASCKVATLGPITIPNLGVEAVF